MKKCPFGIECDDCRFFRGWVMTNDKNEKKVEDRCGLEVLFEEIPRIRGSVDGCQEASNEARNAVFRSVESNEEMRKRLITHFIQKAINQ